MPLRSPAFLWSSYQVITLKTHKYVLFLKIVRLYVGVVLLSIKMTNATETFPLFLWHKLKVVTWKILLEIFPSDDWKCRCYNISIQGDIDIIMLTGLTVMSQSGKPLESKKPKLLVSSFTRFLSLKTCSCRGCWLWV